MSFENSKSTDVSTESNSLIHQKLMADARAIQMMKGQKRVDLSIPALENNQTTARTNITATDAAVRPSTLNTSAQIVKPALPEGSNVPGQHSGPQQIINPADSKSTSQTVDGPATLNPTPALPTLDTTEPVTIAKDINRSEAANGSQRPTNGDERTQQNYNRDGGLFLRVPSGDNFNSGAGSEEQLGKTNQPIYSDGAAKSQTEMGLPPLAVPKMTDKNAAVEMVSTSSQLISTFSKSVNSQNVYSSKATLESTVGKVISAEAGPSMDTKNVNNHSIQVASSANRILSANESQSNFDHVKQNILTEKTEHLIPADLVSASPQVIKSMGTSAPLGKSLDLLESNRKETEPRSVSKTFNPRVESPLQLPDTFQSTGRRESKTQLPDDKQSTRRTDTGLGGASNTNVRPDVRNDANSAKLPDAKTLVGLDQKFGDKLNPTGKGGIPVVMPGLPDVFGGFKGDKDARGGRVDTTGRRDGKELSGKDARAEQATSKDGKTIDGKATGGKVPDGKDVESKIDGKHVSGKNADGKLGPDGRPIDGRQQGGSNLTDGLRGDKTETGARTDAATKGDKPFVLPPGSLPVPDLVNGIRNVGQNLEPRIGRQPLGDSIRTTLTVGVKTAITRSTSVGESGKNSLPGKAELGQGVKTTVTDSHVSNGSKIDVPLMPPPAVQFGELVGNLKAIAAKIFPIVSQATSFDKGLPGRKTERLDTLTAQPQGKRLEPIIPFSRTLTGTAVAHTAENFVIRLSQGNNQDRITVTRTDITSARKMETSTKSVDAKPTERTSQQQLQESMHYPVKSDPSHRNNLEDEQLFHDEAAEKLLVNFELVGTEEETPESDEEEQIFSLKSEQVAGDLEKMVAGDDDDVVFDGDAATAQEGEQDTRYQYIVEAGDTVELIAIKVFKNVTLAPLIYEINKDSIPIGMQDGRMIFILKIGTIIWLPFPKEIKEFMERGDLSSPVNL